MNRFRLLALFLFGIVSSIPGPTALAGELVTVYQSPTCSCCGRWVEHMKENGFAVETTKTTTIAKVKQELGVPMKLTSCHTAVVGGYVVEGHVPAEVVRRLLAEKPPVVGVAVPGMPTGSPGMEGFFEQSYDILTFDKEGKTTVYESRE